MTKKTIYVSPTGSDSNSGTREAPLRTLERASQVPLNSGDAILLKRGSSFGGRLTLNHSSILVSAYGLGLPPKVSTIVINASDVEVSGLAVASSPAEYGIYVGGSNNLIDDVDVSGCIHGIDIGPTAQYNKVLNCNLHHNQKLAPNTPGAYDDYGAVGIVIEGDYNEVGYNTITDNHAPSADFGVDGSAVEIYGGIGNLIHHNTARDNRTFTELGNKRSADNVFAFNTVTSSLDASEFLITRGSSDTNFGPVRGTSAIGNNVKLTGPNSTGFVAYAGVGPNALVLYNNTIEAAGKVGSVEGTIVGGYNRYRGRITFTLLPGDSTF